MRLAVLTSHPIQYYGPLFRELAKTVDLHVFFAHRPTPAQQGGPGFGAAFEWDVDLTSGYAHSFLENVSRRPGTDHYAGCDTPSVGRHLGAGGFDGVLALGWHLKSLRQGILAAKRHGLPVMVRGDSQLAGRRGLLTRTVKAGTYPFLLRAFDAALYVGQRSREYFRRYGYPPKRLFFSPHCIDAQWFADRATGDARRALRSELGIPVTSKVVLFAGKFSPFKRPGDVIEACARLNGGQAATHLLMAGSGELDAALRGQARSAGFPVHFLGFQNQSQMPGVYAAADVLALPSDARETWGLVANEALACGTPIVVSDAVGCAPDLAAKGAAGRTFPLGDVSRLAETLGATLTAAPSPTDLAGTSQAYSLHAASAGVLQALEAIRRKPGDRRR